MSARLRFDTPPQVRRLAYWRASQRVGVIALIGALVGVLTLGDPVGVVGFFVVLGGYLAWWAWMRRRSRMIDRWVVSIPTLTWARDIDEAHRYYNALSEDGKARAAPLLHTLYRLVTITPPVTEGGHRQQSDRIEQRIAALSGLVEAEERMRTAAAEHDDTSDIETARMWQEALRRVEELTSTRH